ncbi:hypothetical protein CTAYLR_003532 [Chrysophaeum taylorii]|uniref:RING-type domain-containing protein n=1 Tax=Chrysophaeum taylorii TaxID=2483200 RepID=A0AAD7UCZ4_9STRA|nr:hypothetical protein CTAYLR_003532 [Chrysophaeum taylorii]
MKQKRCGACRGFGAFSTTSVPSRKGCFPCKVCDGSGHHLLSPCGVCGGLGGFEGENPCVDGDPCPLCGGAGASSKTPCPLCEGLARFSALRPHPSGKYRCALCEGTGARKRKRACENCGGFGAIDHEGVPKPGGFMRCRACAGSGGFPEEEDEEEVPVRKRTARELRDELESERARHRADDLRHQRQRRAQCVTIDALRADRDRLAEALERARDVLLCAICLENDKSTLLLPCSHLATCDTCALPLVACPICSTAVTGKKRVHIP